MSKVVDLYEFAAGRAAARGRRLWEARFPEKLDRHTSLKDLSDRTLLTLARLGPEIMLVINDLIMGAFDLGPGAKFDHLDSGEKMKVLDASLFLIDQIRWECLRRLGWVSGFAGEEYPVVDLVMKHEKIKTEFRPRFPRLSENHPRYSEFLRRRDLDGEAMIRSMIPGALDLFHPE
ncbi:MAG: hypothetical protein AB1896_03030 [Thermodesulfobacteriota bacterium]